MTGERECATGQPSRPAMPKAFGCVADIEVSPDIILAHRAASVAARDAWWRPVAYSTAPVRPQDSRCRLGRLRKAPSGRGCETVTPLRFLCPRRSEEAQEPACLFAIPRGDADRAGEDGDVLDLGWQDANDIDAGRVHQLAQLLKPHVRLA